MLHQLRQRRYLQLGALMLVVAAICIAAGTWQIQRFIEKHDANRLLRANAGRSAQPVADVLGRVGEPTADRRADQGQFRPVTATGTYDNAAQLIVRGRTVNGAVGLLVLTPLIPDRPGDPALLVVRGYVAADTGTVPTVVPAPSTPVRLDGRVQPADHADDEFGRDPSGEVTSINAGEVAQRLGRPVWDGYVELLPGQPGITGVTPMPAPDLSNPAGGAVEPQHLAYIVQWYLFALLALSAPLVMARTDSRRDPTNDHGRLDDFDDHPGPGAQTPDPQESLRQAKLADRYGSVRRT